jgi:hypothetical protein
MSDLALVGDWQLRQRIAALLPARRHRRYLCRAMTTSSETAAAAVAIRTSGRGGVRRCAVAMIDVTRHARSLREAIESRETRCVR